MPFRIPARDLARALACALAVTSCTDGTGASSRHPRAGTYELTTSFDSFQWETPSGPGSGCPTTTPYCTHRAAFTGARLTGSIVTSELAANDPVADALGAQAALVGQFCDVVDGTAGCTSVGPVTSYTYAIGTMHLLNSTAGSRDSVSIELRNDPGVASPLWLTGRVVDGDVIGSISWALAPARSPNAHLGTFVARRR